MKTKTLSFLFLLSLFTACQPFSFGPAESNSACESFNQAESIWSYIAIVPEEKGYRMPRFLPNSNEEIAFLKTGKKENEIIRLNLLTQQQEVLLKASWDISDFDIGEDGQLAFLADGALHVRTSADGDLKLISYPEQIFSTKWFGDQLVIMTLGSKFARINLNGDVLETFSPPNSGPRTNTTWYYFSPWSLSDSIISYSPNELLFTEKEKIYRYHIPGFELIDSLESRTYWDNRDGAMGIINDVHTSLISFSTDQLFISRVNHFYIIDMASGTAVKPWNPPACQALEAGISISADGQSLVLGAAQMLNNPHQEQDGKGYKEYGILLIDADGSNERWLFP